MTDKIILYHASNVPVEKPDLLHSRPYLDFGKGFYLTSLREQAEKYAERFRRRNNEAWLSVYELRNFQYSFSIKQFDYYDREWLEFVSRCRGGLAVEEYDIVIGGIANDKVIVTLERYFSGEISEERALGDLMYERPNNQYCIRSQEVLNDCLTFVESIKL